MADYQSLLTRAVANLPKGHAPSARQAIYDRARRALVNQLRTLRPPLPENDILREEAALDRAIAAVEETFGPIAGPAPEAPPVSSPAPSPPAPPPAAPRPAAAPARPQAAVPPPPAQTAPGAASAAGPAPRPSGPPATAPRPAAPAPRSAAPQAPTYPVRPSVPAGPPPLRANPPPPAAGAKPAPTVQVAPAAGAAPLAPPVGAPRATASDGAAPANLAKVVPSAKGDPAASNAPPVVAALGADGGVGEGAAIGPGEGGRIVAQPGGAANEGQRPSLPALPAEKKRQTWLWPALAVLAGVALSVAVAAILMRQKPQDLAISTPSETQQPAPEPAPVKTAQRAQPSPAEDKSAPAPQPQTPPQQEPGQAAQQPPAADAGQPGGQPAAGEAPAQGQTQAQPQPAEQALPASARAALLIASPDNPQKPVVNLGSTVWSTIPAAPDQPSSVAVKADADIPDLKLHATMTLRKNTDPTLLATHTIDLKFTFADGAPITGFKDVGLPQMRKLDSTASESLNSVRVKIGDDYFLIALAKSDTDTPRNLDLMKTHAWFDFPLLLNDNRIAKLVFQKSAEGQAMLEKAFDAWK